MLNVAFDDDKEVEYFSSFFKREDALGDPIREL